MVDQGLHLLDESDRVRQPGMDFERGFVLPARVDVEEARVTRRTVVADEDAARFGAHRFARFAHDGRDGVFASFLRVKPHDGIEFHGSPPALRHYGGRRGTILSAAKTYFAKGSSR